MCFCKTIAKKIVPAADSPAFCLVLWLCSLAQKSLPERVLDEAVPDVSHFPRVEWTRLLRDAVNGAGIQEHRRNRHLDAADKAMAEANEKLLAGDVEEAHR